MTLPPVDDLGDNLPDPTWAAIAQAVPDAPCRILHLSDLHLGTESEPVVRALETLVERAQPTLMVVSGDITQRARPGQFRAARQLIERLQARCGAPWLAIAGNHDIALFNLLARAAWPLRGFRNNISRDIEPEYNDAHTRVLGVSTVRRWRHKNGVVSPAQVERVVERLQQAAPGQLRVVVTHQPVHVIRPADHRHLLVGHQQAVRRWAEAGADLVLGGHLHVPYVRALVTAPGGVLPALWAVQAGTALSTRVRRAQPNSVNLILYRPAGLHGQDGHVQPASVVVQQWDYERADYAPNRSEGPAGNSAAWEPGAGWFVRRAQTDLLPPAELALAEGDRVVLPHPAP
ncbi:MAG: 3',5'-cyclic adenosine monophosphate phosphodiesterase CpdA [Paracidovorax wautersii]|uniref:3',5'-cyclic adenosine monophosphate phosphodiesterase CpdA n=1 Tax=Paracidovorax wautersii TaxID=1177982 RepID=A0A7V8JPF9_9BURK|nr:MAG: 3',5'-cyclic adenosine monophosphate phosphodiesterase CpdA [Paracidovorax wautersii]